MIRKGHSLIAESEGGIVGFLSTEPFDRELHIREFSVHPEHQGRGIGSVLLRAVALPDEPERIAAGPGLLARRFGLDRCDDSLAITGENDVWLAARPLSLARPTLVTTTRIGVSQGEHLPLRWYLQSSRSVSRRAKGDRRPKPGLAWWPSVEIER